MIKYIFNVIYEIFVLSLLSLRQSFYILQNCIYFLSHDDSLEQI